MSLLRLAEDLQVGLGTRPDDLRDCGSGGGYGRNAGQLQLRRHGDRVRSWRNPETRYDAPPTFHGRVTGDPDTAVLQGAVREAPTRALALPATLIVAIAFAIAAALGNPLALIGTAFFVAAFLRFVITRHRVFTAHAASLTHMLTGYARGATRAGPTT